MLLRKRPKDWMEGVRVSGSGKFGASSDTTERVRTCERERRAERGAMLKNGGFLGSVRGREDERRHRLNNPATLRERQGATQDAATDPHQQPTLSNRMA